MVLQLGHWASDLMFRALRAMSFIMLSPWTLRNFTPCCLSPHRWNWNNVDWGNHGGIISSSRISIVIISNYISSYNSFSFHSGIFWGVLLSKLMPVSWILATSFLTIFSGSSSLYWTYLPRDILAWFIQSSSEISCLPLSSLGTILEVEASIHS